MPNQPKDSVMAKTIADLVEQLRAQQTAKIEERKTSSSTINEVRSACADENRNPTADEAAKVRGADEKKTALDAEIDALTARIAEYDAEIDRDSALDRLSSERHSTEVKSPETRSTERAPAKVTNEERTYTSRKDTRGEASFFVDAFGAQNGDYQARERIERHMKEVRVNGEMQERATTTASFAGLVVPQYLVDAAALLARAGRPFANTVQHQPLPAQGMSFIVPRGTTGASAAIQATENSSVSSTDEVWANLTVPVATIAGQQDVSRQSLERGTPGIDQLIYMDLSGAYAVALDAQVLNGSGAAGQMLGVLGTAGVNQATAFAAAATPTTFYSKTAGQLSAVETTRFLAPTALAMHPRRWNWLLSQVDTTGRPLVSAQANGPMNAIGIFDSPQDTPSSAPVGQAFGLPVITDANIPTAVGSGPEDQVIVYRREDLILWEDGDGMPKQLRFEQTLGNQLTVKLVVYGYGAFTAGRYPSAVGIVGGNSGAGFGLIAPVF